MANNEKAVAEAMNALTSMFPNVDKELLLDTFMACGRDVEKALDQLLVMGCDGLKTEKKQAVQPTPAPAPVSPTPFPSAPPVLSPILSVPAITPIPESNKHVEEKRLETLKQELALEYQRLAETQKTSLAQEKRLEQLRQFIAVEQKKLDDERANFQAEMSKREAEFANKLNLLQAQFQKQAQLEEEKRVQEEAKRKQEKEQRRSEKQKTKEQRKAEKERQREEEVAKRLEALRLEYQTIIADMQQTAVLREDLFKKQFAEKDEEIAALQDRIRDAVESQFQSQAAYERVAKQSLLQMISSLAQGIKVGASKVELLEGDHKDDQPMQERLESFQQNVLKSIASNMTE
jgi:DNA repair exonuclease SbcCD ATPase subunit